MSERQLNIFTIVPREIFGGKNIIDDDLIIKLYGVWAEHKKIGETPPVRPVAQQLNLPPSTVKTYYDYFEKKKVTVKRNKDGKLVVVREK